MILRQLFDPESSTYTYLVGCEQTRDAVIIDPVLEQVERDLKLTHELGLTLRHSLDTHVHADHVTAAGVLRERTGLTTVSGAKGAGCADLRLTPAERLHVGTITISVFETPGHTDDSVCYFTSGFLFTGDTLLIRGNGRTDFQNGDPEALYDSITEGLFAFPNDTVVLPGHDYRGMTRSTIGEEKKFHPRIAGKSKEEFVAIMKGLKLPAPKKLDLAVPTNREGGIPSNAHIAQDI